MPGDEDLPFDVDPFAKRMLLEGTDEIGYLLGREAAIAAYEASHPRAHRHPPRRLDPPPPPAPEGDLWPSNTPARPR